MAITDIDNAASVRVLEAVGFRFERLPSATADGKALRLFAVEAAALPAIAAPSQRVV